MGPEQTPLVHLPSITARLPFLAAGAELGPVALEADVALELAIRPELLLVLGPASVRHIAVLLDPIAGNYSGSGQLHIAASETMLVPIEAGVDVEVLAVVIVGEIPVPVEVDAFGGVRLTIRGSGVGSLDETVTLALTGSTLSFDAVTDLKLGAFIDAELDAIIELNLYDEPLCIYTWPIHHWDIAENAEQYTFPVSLSYGSSGFGKSIGPITSKPIPVRDIEAVVPTVPKTRDCQFLDRLVAILCAKGFLPAELCRTAPAGPPGSFSIGPGHGGDPLAGTSGAPGATGGPSSTAGPTVVPTPVVPPVGPLAGGTGPFDIIWPFPVWRTAGHGDTGATGGTQRPPSPIFRKRPSPPRDRSVIESYIAKNKTHHKPTYEVHHKWPLFVSGPDVESNLVFLTVSEHDSWHRDLYHQAHGYMPRDPDKTKYNIVKFK